MTWSVKERLPGENVASYEGGALVRLALLVLFPQRLRAPRGIQPGHRRHTQTSGRAREVASDWIEPLHRVIGLSTWRPEQITYLCRPPHGCTRR